MCMPNIRHLAILGTLNELVCTFSSSLHEGIALALVVVLLVNYVSPKTSSLDLDSILEVAFHIQFGPVSSFFVE